MTSAPILLLANGAEGCVCTADGALIKHFSTDLQQCTLNRTARKVIGTLGIEPPESFTGTNGVPCSSGKAKVAFPIQYLSDVMKSEGGETRTATSSIFHYTVE